MWGVCDKARQYVRKATGPIYSCGNKFMHFEALQKDSRIIFNMGNAFGRNISSYKKSVMLSSASPGGTGGSPHFENIGIGVGGCML